MQRVGRLSNLNSNDFRINGIALEFYEWFTDTQEDTFCNHIISSVRRSAQLSLSDRSTTNSNESANWIVKKWVQFTKSSWPAFVDTFQDLFAYSIPRHAELFMVVESLL